MIDGFAIRPATTDDESSLLDLRDAVYADYVHEPPELHMATQFDAPKDIARRIVVLDTATGTLAAYAAAWPWKVLERRYRMDLAVHPAYRNRGIGARLLESLVNEIAPEGIKRSRRGSVPTSSRRWRFSLGGASPRSSIWTFSSSTWTTSTWIGCWQ